MGARPEEDSKLLPGDSGSVREEVMLEVEDTRSKEAEWELLLLETDRQVLSRCGEEEWSDERLEDGLDGGSCRDMRCEKPPLLLSTPLLPLPGPVLLEDAVSTTSGAAENCPGFWLVPGLSSSAVGAQNSGPPGEVLNLKGSL